MSQFDTALATLWKRGSTSSCAWSARAFRNTTPRCRSVADDPIRSQLAPIATGVPHPSECDLYYVDRDALFSFHKV